MFLAVFNTSINATLPELTERNLEFVTPHFENDEYNEIEHFYSSNNLRRKAGSPFLAKGEMLVVKGVVVDILDQPIDGAVIKIWHANYVGAYQDFSAKGEFDKDFAGNGTCVTDKKGRYSFTTIMPYFYNKRAPHIHIYVKKNGFDSLNTEMFFPNHPRNKQDVKFMSVPDEKRFLITADIAKIFDDSNISGKIAKFNIRLNGIRLFGVY